jgi:hypothetical protein
MGRYGWMHNRMPPSMGRYNPNKIFMRFKNHLIPSGKIK